MVRGVKFLELANPLSDRLVFANLAAVSARVCFVGNTITIVY